MSWILDRVRKAVVDQEENILMLLREGKIISAYEEVTRIVSQVSSNLGVEMLFNFRNKKQLADWLFPNAYGISDTFI